MSVNVASYCQTSGINVRAPNTPLEHLARRYNLVVKTKYRVSNAMPLNDTHRLGDTIRTVPVILGDGGHFIEREGCGDGVINVPSLVRDICVHVVGSTECETHVNDPE